jgi:DNA-binding CsgD family transcriptional regulator
MDSASAVQVSGSSPKGVNRARTLTDEALWPPAPGVGRLWSVPSHVRQHDPMGGRESAPGALARAIQRVATYQPGTVVRLLVPMLMVSSTLLVADLLRWIFPGSGVFLLLLLSVLVTATAIGAVSGLLTVAVGLAGATLLAAVRSHPWLTESTDTLRVVPYLFVRAFIVLVGSALRATVATRPIISRRPRAALVEPLTEREVEVLALAASGLNTHQIAERLVLSRNTVKTHLTHAYAKLGAHNRAEAIAAGLHAGTLGRREVTSRAPQITAGYTRPQPQHRMVTGRHRAGA